MKSGKPWDEALLSLYKEKKGDMKEVNRFLRNYLLKEKE